MGSLKARWGNLDLTSGVVDIAQLLEYILLGKCSDLKNEDNRGSKELITSYMHTAENISQDG